MKPLIRTENISVTYNVGKPNEFQSLKEVNVGIYPEEFTIIYGPSGCGKSTLLYSISALQRPTTGEMYVGETALSTMSARDRAVLRQTAIGMIFQSFYLIPSLNVLDNVCLPRVFRNEKKQERMDAGIRLLRRFGIVEQADKYPSQLSGGQKQRVAIARSLINDPEIILADEPVGNLDSKSAENVLTILQELRDVDKKAVVLVTHDPSHLSLANRIFFMKDGAVVEERVQKSATLQKKEDGANGADMQKTDSVSKELEILLRSFVGMPREQSRILLNPFKAEKLVDHVLLALSEEQVALAKKYAAELFFGEADFSEFEKSLDKELELGGAGWDKRRASATRKRIESIVNVAETVRRGIDAPEAILRHIQETFFAQELSDEKSVFLLNLLRKRTAFDIGFAEMRDVLDATPQKGGLGFHRALAGKVAREIEVIMLAAH